MYQEHVKYLVTAEIVYTDLKNRVSIEIEEAV